MGFARGPRITFLVIGLLTMSPSFALVSRILRYRDKR